jgi:hypothetical protein
VFFLNDEGQLTVINSAGKWEVLHLAELGEPAYATPAIVDGRIYIRTAGKLFSFGLPN